MRSLLKRLNFSSWTKRIAIFLILALIIVIVGIISFWALGFVYNLSDSLQPGIYKEIKKTPEVNDYVEFCPTDAPIFETALHRGYLSKGRCEGKAVMLKKILAGKGDHVVINDTGVYVNDNLLPFSKPLLLDGAKRPLPQYRTDLVVPDGYILTMTDYSPMSFDSRYYGLIPKSQVISVVVPFYIWRK